MDGHKPTLKLSAMILDMSVIQVYISYMRQVINPRRACAARVTVLGLCVCVSVSVTTFSATVRNHAPNKIYQRLQRDMSKVLEMVFSFKNASFRSYGDIG